MKGGPGWLGGRSPATPVRWARKLSHLLPLCNPNGTGLPTLSPNRRIGAPNSLVWQAIAQWGAVGGDSSTTLQAGVQVGVAGAFVQLQRGRRTAPAPSALGAHAVGLGEERAVAPAFARSPVTARESAGTVSAVRAQAARRRADDGNKGPLSGPRLTLFVEDRHGLCSAGAEATQSARAAVHHQPRGAARGGAPVTCPPPPQPTGERNKRD